MSDERKDGSTPRPPKPPRRKTEPFCFFNRELSWLALNERVLELAASSHVPLLERARFLAIFAGVSACFFLFYNVPAIWLGMHADSWPEDHQERSYFNGGICGDGTDKPCPNPDLPMPTKHSGYINIDGQLVLPDGVEIPAVVPFERGN